MSKNMDKLSRINRRACNQLASLRKKFAKVKLKKEFQGVNHPLYVPPLPQEFKAIPVPGNTAYTIDGVNYSHQDYIWFDGGDGLDN